MASGTGATVEFRGVTKHYGDNIAVDHLTFTVPARRICVLIGPVGVRPFVRVIVFFAPIGVPGHSGELVSGADGNV